MVNIYYISVCAQTFQDKHDRTLKMKGATG